MTAFTFSAEQIRSAPREVRRWIANEIAHALAGVAPHPDARQEPEPPQRLSLAACNAPEMAQIAELIGHDPVATRLLFGLAHDSAIESGVAELHVLRTDELVRNAGLGGNEALVAGLTAIDRAFRQVCGDRHGNLFGFVDPGHVYIHEKTRNSIRRVWEELIQAQAAAERLHTVDPVPPMQGFIPPHLGPSEDVAAHGRPFRVEEDLPL